MAYPTTFPQSAAEVLDVIVAEERSRKFVWTASRVVMKIAGQGDLEALDSQGRKDALFRIAGFLNELMLQGRLAQRDILQSIGYGNETGFDFISPKS